MNDSNPGADRNAAAFFLLLAGIFYLPHLFALRTFPDGDFTHHFLPFSLFQQRELLAGRLPLWNPYTYSGHPFLADVQAAVFYPLSNAMILLSLPFRGLSTEAGVRLYFLQAEAALHVGLAGIFVYLLVRELTGQRSAAILAGCTFAFSGYLTSYPPLQLAVLRTAIWLPLVLWLLLRAFNAPVRWRWWLGAAAAYACAFLAGHPQTFLLMSYTVAGWWMWLLVWRWRSARQHDTESSQRSLIPVLMGTLAFAAAAVGVSAAQWWPSVEFTRLSVRASTDYAFVSGGFPLRDTWQLLLPGVLTQYSPLYVGVIGLGLAVCAVGLLGKHGEYRESSGESPVSGLQSPASALRSPNTTLFFLALTLVALLLSYGGNGFLYPLFYRFAPGWDLFRGQERAAYLVAFGLSVLAGYGMAALPVLPLSRRRLLVALFSVVTIAGVYAFGLLWQLPGRTAIGQWTYLGVALVTLLLTMVFAVLAWWEGWSLRRSIILIILTLLTLFLFNVPTNIAPFGPARKAMLAPEMEALQAAVEQSDADTGLPGRVYNEFRIYADYGMRQQIEDVWGSSPLRLAHYAALFDTFPLDRMWRLTGVEHVLTWRREIFGPSDLLAEFPQATDTTYLHRLLESNPRAWAVSHVQTATDADARARLADHGFDLDEIALLPPDAPAVSLPGTDGRGNVQLARPTPNRLRVQVESDAAGLLVIGENWMPGWRVRNLACAGPGADSVACPTPPVLRANLTFIGIPIDPGRTTFDLVYWPDSVRNGLIVSGAALLLLTPLALGRWWRGRRA
jgi:hypothetical protein